MPLMVATLQMPFIFEAVQGDSAAAFIEEYYKDLKKAAVGPVASAVLQEWGYIRIGVSCAWHARFLQNAQPLKKPN